MSPFKNTTYEYHDYLAARKKADLKYRAQGTDGFIWIMLLGVLVVWLCRNENASQFVHKWGVAAVGSVPYGEDR